MLGIAWWIWLAAWTAGALVAGVVGMKRDRPVLGVIVGVLLGPLGGVVSFFLPYGGDILCGSCGKRTPYAAMPAGWTPNSGGSYPHLRCRRCGSIVQG